MFKRLGLLSVTAVILLFSCKKEQSNNEAQASVREEASELLTENINVLYDAVQQYAQVLQSTGDSLAAMDSMQEFLVSHESFNGGWIHNDEYLEVQFDNGLTSPINIIAVDENGIHLTRGGGRGNKLTAWSDDSKSIQLIKNEKVFIASPQSEEFGYSDADFTTLDIFIGTGGDDFELTVARDEQFTLAKLDELDDYGLVIFDTHGAKNGIFMTAREHTFEMTDIWFPEDVINSVFDLRGVPPEKLLNGQVQLGVSIYPFDDQVVFEFSILVTEQYIRQLNIDLSDVVIFGNHCYSGHHSDGPNLNNMREAWRSLGAAVYFGYAEADGSSAPVDNGFCQDMEQSLLGRLVVDKDSTGVAHLDMQGITQFYLPSKPYRKQRVLLSGGPRPPRPTAVWPIFFYQYLDDDYAYEEPCDPILDIRDLNEYETVCIGEQTWMAENLRWEGAGVCAFDNSANCDVHGRLYSMPEVLDGATSFPDLPPVQGICPDGWHVPSIDEWQELIDYSGGPEQALIKLRASEPWINADEATDEFGFNLVPHTFTWIYDGAPIESIEYPSTSLNHRYGTRLWSSTAEYGLIAPFTGVVYDRANVFKMGYDSNEQYEVTTNGGAGYAADGEFQNEEREYLPCRCIKN